MSSEKGKIMERLEKLLEKRWSSLRSKRFRKVFNEKCLERAENLTETLATQANAGETLEMILD